MLGRSVAWITIGNVASKFVGVVREALFATWFGTTEVAAAFRITQSAFILPTHGLIGDTLSAGMLPLYRQLSAEGEGRERILLVAALLYGLLISAVIAVLLYVYSQAVVAFIAPGASSGALVLAAKLLEILSLATPFYVLSGVLSYVEAGHGEYSGIAWRPMILNVGSVFGAGFAVYSGHQHWLATGLVVGHVAFFVWTVLQLRKIVDMAPVSASAFQELWGIGARFLRNTAPLLGLPLIAQANGLVERVVSSWLGTNVIPSVDYARFVSETVIQLIAVPLGILTMSTHGGSSPEASKRHVLLVAGVVLICAFPAAAFVAQNSQSLVTLLFARGKFTQGDVLITSGILRWLGVSLGPAVVGYYLVKALNAQLRNGEALAVTIAAAAANVLVNLWLWRVFGPSTLGIAAAASAVVLFACCQTRLGLWRGTLPLLVWVLVGCATQLALSSLVAARFAYPVDLLISAIVSLGVWLSLVARVQVLRVACEPLIKRIPLLKRCIA